MTPFAYAKPADIEQALGLAGPESRYIAGGTNLLDLMKETLPGPGASSTSPASRCATSAGRPPAACWSEPWSATPNWPGIPPWRRTIPC